MNIKIIPTVFSHNKKEFNERFSKLIKISKTLQIDFMDGLFVKSKSLSIKDLPKLKGKGNFEAHLMMKHPEKYISQLKDKGFKKVLFHFNSGDNVKVISEIKKRGMKAFLALNPEIEIKQACYLFDLVDGVLLMGVHPGKEHQKFINSTYSKVREIRKINKTLPIQVDGGINPSNATRLTKLGVNILNTGSFVSDSANPKRALAALRNA